MDATATYTSCRRRRSKEGCLGEVGGDKMEGERDRGCDTCSIDQGGTVRTENPKSGIWFLDW
jgi:hypothetical protein